jgi:threonine dehydrogenase-like Zn-dependent dehydrogenase
MKALVWRGGSLLALEDVPEPQPGPGEVVVQVVLAGICGSDLHAYRGHDGVRTPPLVLGHEAVARTPHGSRAAIFPLISCGACHACRRDERSLCERRVLMGLNRPGVFAERVAVPEGLLVPVPDDLADQIAVLAEPLANAVAVIRRAQISAGRSVLVIGCGSIGLLLVHAATQSGARVIAADPVPERRRQASLLGADQVLASAEDAAAGSVDLAIDAVGAQQTWTAGMRAVRAGGSVVIVGLAQANGSMPVGDLVRRGISIRGHYAYERGDFDAAISLLATAPPQFDGLPILPLGQGAEAFRRMTSDLDSAVKVLLRAGPEAELLPEASSALATAVPQPDQPASRSPIQ